MHRAGLQMGRTIAHNRYSVESSLLAGTPPYAIYTSLALIT